MKKEAQNMLYVINFSDELLSEYPIFPIKNLLIALMITFMMAIPMVMTVIRDPEINLAFKYS